MKGLTLLETVIAGFLLFLVLLLVLNLFPGALAGLRARDHVERAQTLAESQLAALMVSPFSRLASQDLYDHEEGGTRYHTSLEVASLKPRLRALRVTVTWRERGQDRTLTRERWRVQVNR